MPYKKILPIKALKPYVESIWIQDDDTDASKVSFPPTRLLPVPKIDFIFHFKDPFASIEGNSVKILPMFHVTGHRTKPHQVFATGKTGLIIVCFFPWGAASLINLNIQHITDQIIDLTDIYGAKIIKHFEEIFMSAKTVAGKLKIVQEFLINNIQTNSRNGIIKPASYLINNKGGNIRITNIAKEFGITRRTLNRIFTNITGIDPKLFARIIRFQKAILYKKAGYNWWEICESCNYYDQSHLIKEFKEFTGFSPDNFAPVDNTGLKKYFNTAPALSHFYNTIYL